MGERIESELELNSAEDMVKAVISRVNSANSEQQEKKMKPLRILYITALIIGGALCLFCNILGRLSENCMIIFSMAAFFGLYFSFFAKERLPDYYDQNRIGTYNHGPVRMNIPGIRFTNGNFPHIVRYITLWSSATLLLCPTFTLLFGEIALGTTDVWIMAALLILGLVLPLYIIGKKYE